MPTRLVLTAPRVLEFVELPGRRLQEGEVRLRSLMSGISHGTELNLYRGTSPFEGKRFDQRHRVFVPAKPEGESLFLLGYDLVGEVVEVGPEVTGVQVGDLIHAGLPHQDESILKLPGDDEAYPPVKLPDRRIEKGIFVSLASVALQAIHDARIKVGDAVVVSGAGVIGLLAAQLARLNGAASVIVIEPRSDRRQLALQLGASEALDPNGSEATTGLAVKEALGGQGADIAIETSGVYAGLHDSIASVGVGGTVVAAGYYQGGGADLRLGEEWHHNRPTLVSSMGVWGCPHRDHPLWNRPRMMRTAVDLIYTDRLNVDPLLTEALPFEKAPDAYVKLDNGREAPLKIALTYHDSAFDREG